MVKEANSELKAEGISQPSKEKLDKKVIEKQERGEGPSEKRLWVSMGKEI